SKVDALVDAAITEGKVAPADKAMYVGLCSTEAGRQQFTAWCGRAPVIADASKVKTTTEQAGDLSKDELAMCRAANVKPETWLANRHHKPAY
ncbi:MAG: peptidase, partial [Corallincola sp.]|nr:peptidase [Corallincola sp.]